MRSVRRHRLEILDQVKKTVGTRKPLRGLEENQFVITQDATGAGITIDVIRRQLTEPAGQPNCQPRWMGVVGGM